ncbi:MAG TPA: hypothetical protein VN840_04555 [Streptosporangiaceae bacterium]|nr:hypothetical protein [Streptosporangiaceae bacterium]
MGRNFIRQAAVIIAPVAAISFVLVGQGASASARSDALACQASVSNTHPSDFTTVYVHVRTVSHANVTAVAHFKTGNVPASREANGHGRATVSFHVGGAAPGYKVKVSVTVKSGAEKGSCSTSFTPKA